MKKVSSLLMLLISFFSFAQSGVIRGVIIDKQSEKGIAGATVLLLSEPTNGVTTSDNGSFELRNVPVGRQTIRVTMLGYESSTFPDLDVTTGKDVVITISLTEQFNSLEEVVVVGEGNNKAKSINKLAAVSVRQFSPEEVNRYAGGRSDVARWRNTWTSPP